jgi:hypothetical protein
MFVKYRLGIDLQLTPDGAGAGTPISMNGSPVDLVLSKLPGPEARILRAVTQIYPKSAINEEAAVMPAIRPPPQATRIQAVR